MGSHSIGYQQMRFILFYVRIYKFSQNLPWPDHPNDPLNELYHWMWTIPEIDFYNPLLTIHYVVKIFHSALFFGLWSMIWVISSTNWIAQISSICSPHVCLNASKMIYEEQNYILFKPLEKNTCNGTILTTGWRQSSTWGTSITRQDPLGHTNGASPFEHITSKRRDLYVHEAAESPTVACCH